MLDTSLADPARLYGGLDYPDGHLLNSQHNGKFHYEISEVYKDVWRCSWMFGVGRRVVASANL